MHWDHRAAQLAEQEAAGKPNARLNAQEALAVAPTTCVERLERRLAELDRESQISARPAAGLAGRG